MRPSKKRRIQTETPPASPPSDPAFVVGYAEEQHNVETRPPTYSEQSQGKELASHAVLIGDENEDAEQVCFGMVRN